MFLVLPFVILASFFGKVRGGDFIYHICRFWANAAVFCWGIRHRNYYELPHNSKHAVIFVFNHISYLDIPILLLAINKQPIRVLGKAEMAKIPIFGYIYKKAAVLVDRSDAAHRAESVETMKAVLRKNISIVMAPEGTFNMTGRPLKDFYDGAFKIAQETNTPIQPVLFLDTFDRLNYASVFSFSPGKSRAVFLNEIKPCNNEVGDFYELKQKVYKAMEAGLIKYDASWIKDPAPDA